MPYSRGPINFASTNRYLTMRVPVSSHPSHINHTLNTALALLLLQRLLLLRCLLLRLLLQHMRRVAVQIVQCILAHVGGVAVGLNNARFISLPAQSNPISSDSLPSPFPACWGRWLGAAAAERSSDAPGPGTGGRRWGRTLLLSCLLCSVGDVVVGF